MLKTSPNKTTTSKIRLYYISYISLKIFPDWVAKFPKPQLISIRFGKYVFYPLSISRDGRVPEPALWSSCWNLQLRNKDAECHKGGKGPEAEPLNAYIPKTPCKSELCSVESRVDLWVMSCSVDHSCHDLNTHVPSKTLDDTSSSKTEFKHGDLRRWLGHQTCIICMGLVHVRWYWAAEFSPSGSPLPLSASEYGSHPTLKTARTLKLQVKRSQGLLLVNCLVSVISLQFQELICDLKLSFPNWREDWFIESGVLRPRVII